MCVCVCRKSHNQDVNEMDPGGKEKMERTSRGLSIRVDPFLKHHSQHQGRMSELWREVSPKSLLSTHKRTSAQSHNENSEISSW